MDKIKCRCGSSVFVLKLGNNDTELVVECQGKNCGRKYSVITEHDRDQMKSIFRLTEYSEPEDGVRKL